MTQRSSKLDLVVNVAIIATLAVLLFGPSGIVGRWVAGVNEDRHERRRIAEAWTELVEAGSRLGLDDNARTIVEFVDYECPACRSVSPAVSEAAGSGVTVVFRHFPLTRIHPAARDAALVAVCAERYGVFAEVHEAMMADDGWMLDGNWSDLAMRVGITDDGALEACMDDSDTLQRLRRDRELAELLGVRGTPTFVTREGTFLGPDGWAQALETLPSAAGGSPSAFELSGDTVFDSAAHPDLAISMLGRLSNTMFLPGDRLLIQDGAWFHFVDLQTGKAATVGGRGRGPGEFQAPFQAVRSSDGIVVWDLVLGRLTYLSASGEYVDSRRLDTGALRSPVAPLVAALGDGSVVFRDDSTSVMIGDGWPDGVHREPARYVSFSPDGHGRLIHKARGSEVMYREPMHAPIIFAHHVLESSMGDRLAIAQTDLPALGVYDGNGALVSQLPIPGPLAVSRSQIASARNTAIEEERTDNAAHKELGLRVGGSLLSNDVSANDPAPPIDGMFADLDGRLWLRRYRLPGDSAVRWQAWDIDNASVKFVLRILPGESLRDATGDRVLLHVRDALDVDRVLVRRIAAGKGQLNRDE